MKQFNIQLQMDQQTLNKLSRGAFRERGSHAYTEGEPLPAAVDSILVGYFWYS